MPIPDGRIRSRDLDNGSVNSRVIDDLRSSNWNGDPEDPDTSPGSFGWAIFKSGLLIANNAIFRGTIQAARILSGVLHIGGTGKVTAGADEDNPTSTFDASGLTVGNAPVVIDADGLDIGNGLVEVDSSGLTVGSDVVIDSTGLEVDGGKVQAVWFDSAESGVNDTSLNTTVKQVNSVTVNPPSWVEQVTVFGFARGSWDNSSGGIQSLENAMVLDDGGSGEDRVSSIQQSSNNIRDTHQLIEEATFALSPSGRSISTIQEARVLSGSNSDNVFSLKVFVIGVRSSFT